MNEIPKLVASRSITSSAWNNTVVTADIVTELRQRKAATNGPIYIFGSAELVDGLLHAGLVDELLLCIAPVVLGSGNPFFKTADRQRDLMLLETRVAGYSCSTSALVNPQLMHSGRGSLCIYAHWL